MKKAFFVATLAVLAVVTALTMTGCKDQLQVYTWTDGKIVPYSGEAMEMMVFSADIFARGSIEDLGTKTKIGEKGMMTVDFIPGSLTEDQLFPVVYGNRDNIKAAVMHIGGNGYRLVMIKAKPGDWFDPDRPILEWLYADKAGKFRMMMCDGFHQVEVKAGWNLVSYDFSDSDSANSIVPNDNGYIWFLSY